MAAIPGFRDALFKSMADRLRTADARLAAAQDEDEDVEVEPPKDGHVNSATDHRVVDDLTGRLRSR